MRLAAVVVTSVLLGCMQPTDADIDEPPPTVVDNPGDNPAGEPTVDAPPAFVAEVGYIYLVDADYAIETQTGPWGGRSYASRLRSFRMACDDYNAGIYGNNPPYTVIEGGPIE